VQLGFESACNDPVMVVAAHPSEPTGSDHTIPVRAEQELLVCSDPVMSFGTDSANLDLDCAATRIGPDAALPVQHELVTSVGASADLANLLQDSLVMPAGGDEQTLGVDPATTVPSDKPVIPVETEPLVSMENSLHSDPTSKLVVCSAPRQELPCVDTLLFYGSRKRQPCRLPVHHIMSTLPSMPPGPRTVRKINKPARLND